MAPHHEGCWGSPQLNPMAMDQRGASRVHLEVGQHPAGQCRPQSWLAEPLPAVPAGLGTGGEARDLDVVPIFPLKLLFSRDSSSA